MSIINFRSVSLSFPNGFSLFENLNFSLDRELTGLVGPNGVGKTSIARMMSGELEPTKGQIFKSQRVFYFPQTETAEPITVGEYLLPDFEWTPYTHNLIGGIEVDQYCNRLSGGEWMRVRLARAFNRGYLVLDEPSNSLDSNARLILEDFLSCHRGGALIISHGRRLLKRCEHILELSNLGLKKFRLNYSEYSDVKQLEYTRLMKSLEESEKLLKLQRTKRTDEMRKQNKRNFRGKRKAIKTGMSKIEIAARKQSAQKTSGHVISESIEKIELAHASTRDALKRLKIENQMFASLVSAPLPKQVLVAEAINYNVFGSSWIYPTDLNFVWRGPIRLALKGKNGSGKSTLLKQILNPSLKCRGNLRVGQLNAAYIAQSVTPEVSDQTLFEYLRENTGYDSAEIRNQLAAFLFPKDSVFRELKHLSGGERLRASLAKALIHPRGCDLLILDEPTNNLDLINIEYLEETLRNFKGALIVVSHDEDFLQGCQLDDEYQLD